jgi:hypothetical protein
LPEEVHVRRHCYNGSHRCSFPGQPPGPYMRDGESKRERDGTGSFPTSVGEIAFWRLDLSDNHKGKAPKSYPWFWLHPTNYCAERERERDMWPVSHFGCIYDLSMIMHCNNFVFWKMLKRIRRSSLQTLFGNLEIGQRTFAFALSPLFTIILC